jgi:hypothetical protein
MSGRTSNRANHTADNTLLGGIMLIRFLTLLAGLATTLALASGAMADRTRTTTIDATIAGTGCGVKGTSCGGTCCVLYWNFAGRGIIAPPLGSLSLNASYDVGVNPFSDPVTRLRDLTLSFVAGNGDQLTLVEQATWLAADVDPPSTWTVDGSSSTGRFAGVTGSGSYALTVGVADDGTFATFVLSLTGSLTVARVTD